MPPLRAFKLRGTAPIGGCPQWGRSSLLNDLDPLSFRVGVDGRVVHGLDGYTRLVIAAAIGGVEDNEEDLLLAGLELEICDDAVVADVLVIDVRNSPGLSAEPRVFDLEAGGREVGQHEVLET